MSGRVGSGGPPAGMLQRGVDEVLGTSGQQWLLGVGAVVAATTAFVTASVASGGWWIPGLVAVILLAVASAVRPDGPTALVVVAAVLWQWVARIDDLGTPWLPVTAVCLVVFHGLIALTAAVPTGGTIPVATLRRWTQRTAVVSGATFAMWILVVALERRDLSGNGLLTGLALVIVAGASAVIRARSTRSETR